MIRERQVNGWAGALCPRLTPRPKSHKSHVSHVSHAQPLQNPLGASWRRIENRGLLMWFDPRKALAPLGDLDPPQAFRAPCRTSRTCRTPPPAKIRHIVGKYGGGKLRARGRERAFFPV